MKVLLSIKPNFAEQIFNGSKTYEFRRTIFKNKNIRTVVVYVSSPIQQVIGEFEIGEIIYAPLSVLWKRTQLNAGLSRKEFYKYFTDKEKGYAIKIKKIHKYRKPLSLKQNFRVNPPQSFIYL